MSLITTYRYQLNKDSALAIKRGHPWIFKKHLSSAIQALPQNSLLKLVDGQNNFVSYAINEELGVVGLRVIHGLEDPASLKSFTKIINVAITKKTKANAYRLINGEGDTLPGLVLDYYNGYLVWQPYLKFWLPYLEAFDKYIATKIKVKGSFIKPAFKIEKSNITISEPIEFTEEDMHFNSYPISGQKTGFFLDLKDLRAALKKHSLNKSVLNTFANTGALSAICLKHGATKCISIEESPLCLDQAKEIFILNKLTFENSNWLIADTLDTLLKIEEKFDLIILDPPQLTSKNDSLKNALAYIHKLLLGAKQKLNPNGIIVLAICTGLISGDMCKELFKETLVYYKIIEKGGLPKDHTTLKEFPEGNYLKWWFIKLH